MLVAGGLLGLLSATTGAGRHVWDVVDVVTVVGAACAGGSLVLFGHRLPTAWLHVIVAGAILATSIAQWEDGTGVSATSYTLLYVWMALYVGYFFSMAAAGGHLALLMLANWIVLTSFDGDHQLEFLVLAGSVCVVAGVTNWLSFSNEVSRVDPLTGIPNRRGLDRVLQAAMRAAEAADAALVVGLLDLDDFRRVNDHRGHDGGDRLLVACVAAWQTLLPPGATVARYDGDGFVVVAPGHRLREAQELVERLRVAVPARQTCSAGLAAWEHGDTQSMLIGRADTALYAAKREGGDCLRLVGVESELAAELVAAISDGQMELHYQPIYSLPDGRIEAVEALVRWRHPSRGLVAPDEFIPLAERTGAIHSLGRWVTDTACEQLQWWRTRLPEAADLSVAINVSPSQLPYARLVDDLHDALERLRLLPSAVIVEITESAFGHDTVDAGAVLADLRGLGVRLAMDDFGTGHSSLARLRALPFDMIKIDRSFVAMLGADGDPMFGAIVELASSLGLETVVEGIEESSQLGLVAGYGCTRAQGFLLGRPQPADAITELLRDDDRTAMQLAAMPAGLS